MDYSSIICDELTDVDAEAKSNDKAMQKRKNKNKTKTIYYHFTSQITS